FASVEWVILDEIHEVCSSKRGSLLSICLERLREQTGQDFVRIGLSATIAPIEEEAKFLAGFSNGKVRDMHIVEVDTRKSLDLAVLCPVRDITAVPMEVANARMYDLLSDLIDEHRTTLIFTNTRSGTEHVSFRLKERGVEDLEAHHGSLSHDRLRTVGPHGVCDPRESRLRRPDRPRGDPAESAGRARPGHGRDVPGETLGHRRGVRARPAVLSVPRPAEEGLPRRPGLPL